MRDLKKRLMHSDILIVATGAQNPTVQKSIITIKKSLINFRFIHSEKCK